jgi:hypothetical protein
MDWLAWPLVGSEAEPMTKGLRKALGEFSVRVADRMAARTRMSEDWLASSGATEYVVLGAGLDSFAWRQPSRSGIRVIEVDHPSTQAWKRSRIDSPGIPVPSTLTWAPVDFEVESVDAGLKRAGVRGTVDADHHGREGLDVTVVVNDGNRAERVMDQGCADRAEKPRRHATSPRPPTTIIWAPLVASSRVGTWGSRIQFAVDLDVLTRREGFFDNATVGVCLALSARVRSVSLRR